MAEGQPFGLCTDQMSGIRKVLSPGTHGIFFAHRTEELPSDIGGDEPGADACRDKCFRAREVPPGVLP